MNAPVHAYAITLFRKRLGIMTSSEALRCAIHASEQRALLPPNDRQLSHLRAQEESYLEYAQMLEQEENQFSQALVGSCEMKQTT